MTTSVTAAVLWVTKPETIPARPAPQLVLIAVRSIRRAAGPASGVRLAAMKRMPVNSRPSPVRSEVSRLMIGKLGSSLFAREQGRSNQNQRRRFRVRQGNDVGDSHGL